MRFSSGTRFRTGPTESGLIVFWVPLVGSEAWNLLTAVLPLEMSLVLALCWNRLTRRIADKHLKVDSPGLLKAGLSASFGEKTVIYCHLVLHPE
jgi:hypothetical protein